MISKAKSVLDVSCNLDTNEVMINGTTVKCEDAADREFVFATLNRLREHHLELLAWAQRVQYHLDAAPRPPTWIYP